MPTVTARFPEALDDDVENRLRYGEDKSSLVRDGARVMVLLHDVAADGDVEALYDRLQAIDLETLDLEDLADSDAEPVVPDGGENADG